MPYGIADRVYLAVYIEGTELPFSETFTLNYVHLSASRNQVIPVAVISVTDSLGWLVQASLLKDGARIRVVVSNNSEGSTQKEFTFRQSAVQETPAASGSKYVIEGYLDFPKYLMSSSRTPMQGTSSELLKEIATTAGLEFEGVGTNDSQTWNPQNRRLYAFASFIAAHGYGTDNSAMALAVDLSGKMIYRDITSMDNSVLTLGFADFTSPGVAPVLGQTFKSMSGAGNQIAGYKLTTIDQDPIATDGLLTQNSAVGTVINEPGDPARNKDLVSDGREGRVSFGPVDAGNAHENFIRARHQNQRVDALFTSVVPIVSGVLTDVKVLDTVNLDVSNAKEALGDRVAMYEGTYRVKSKVIYITPGRVVEKLTLERRTIKLPDSTGSQASDNLITDEGSQLQRSLKLVPPIGSELSIPGLDVVAMAARVGAMGSTVANIMSQTGAALSGVVANAQTTSEDTPPVTPLLQALLNDLQAIEDLGVANINAILLVDPADVAGDIPVEIVARTGDLDGAINAQHPAIQQAATRSAANANMSLGVNTGASAVAPLQDTIQSAVSAIANAMKKVAPPGAIDSAVTAANATVTSAKTAYTTSVGNAVTAANASANALLVDATTYDAQIAAKRQHALDTWTALDPNA